MFKVRFLVSLISLALSANHLLNDSHNNFYDGAKKNSRTTFAALLLAFNPVPRWFNPAFVHTTVGRAKLHRTSTRGLRQRKYHEIAMNIQEDELSQASDESPNAINSISGLRRVEVRSDLEENTIPFEEVGISVPGVIDNLKAANIIDANALQRASFDLIKDGNDVIIHAWTGSGKTLAFLLPLLENLVNTSKMPQALILCASREVAHQIGRVATHVLNGTSFRSLVIAGGANGNRQRENLKKNKPQIIIGTPGRVLELATMRNSGKQALNLRHVRHLVIDEVDETVRPPHANHTLSLIDVLKPNRQVQKIFASATADTFPVRRAATQIMHSPVLLRLQAPSGVHRSGQTDMPEMPSSILHGVIPVQKHFGKALQAVKALHNLEERPKTLVFVNTPTKAREVVQKLQEQHNIQAGVLLGEQERIDRVNVMRDFLGGSLRIVVTTEVGARGLDIPGLTHVVNLDFPTDAKHYVHRAGRCGRAGATGTVVNLAPPGQEWVVSKFTDELGVDLHEMHTRDGQLTLGRAPFRNKAKAAKKKTTKKKKQTGSALQKQELKQKREEKKQKPKLPLVVS